MFKWKKSEWAKEKKKRQKWKEKCSSHFIGNACLADIDAEKAFNYGQVNIHT